MYVWHNKSTLNKTELFCLHYKNIYYILNFPRAFHIIFKSVILQATQILSDVYLWIDLKRDTARSCFLLLKFLSLYFSVFIFVDAFQFSDGVCFASANYRNCQIVLIM